MLISRGSGEVLLIRIGVTHDGQMGRRLRGDGVLMDWLGMMLPSLPHSRERYRSLSHRRLASVASCR